MKRSKEVQSLFKLYREETGSDAVDMVEFAKWMAKKGWPLPTPADPFTILAKQLTEAIREETRKDAKTGLPYKANLSFSPDSKGQGSLWIDVDEAPRPVVLKCLVQRREQMVGDAYQLTLIQDHWNNTHPQEEPIQLPLDLQFDVDWRKNGGDAGMDAA